MRYSEMIEEWNQLNETRKALVDARFLMQNVCPTRGWCLSGTGADYARRAQKRLDDQISLASLREIELRNLMIFGPWDK